MIISLGIYTGITYLLFTFHDSWRPRFQSSSNLDIEIDFRTPTDASFPLFPLSPPFLPFLSYGRRYARKRPEREGRGEGKGEPF